MTTPFPFTLGQTLTAAQMNAITELVVNDKTASYTLVAGDAGERVIMNSASATTITVNTSIFTAGQVIYVTNKGAGVCTITAGTATVSTTGTLALAQFASGVLYCISAGVFIFEAYGVAASAGGLTFLSSTTFTTATNVSLPANTFSATYQTYRVMLQVTALTADALFTMRLRATGTDNTTSDYRTAGVGVTSVGVAVTKTGNGTTSFNFAEQDSATTGYSLVFDIIGPQLATFTNLHGQYGFFAGSPAGFEGVNFINNFLATTQFDSLTFISSVATSMTGKIDVFGYAIS